MTTTMYQVVWTAPDGVDEFPGCDEETATFSSYEEATSAVEDLLATGEWDDCDLRVVVVEVAE